MGVAVALARGRRGIDVRVAHQGAATHGHRLVSRVWNFLDNVKAHIENPDLAAEVGIASGEEALAAALEASRAINPEGEDWESFGGADGEEEEREATGFDWEAWEAFAARNAAATRGNARARRRRGVMARGERAGSVPRRAYERIRFRARLSYHPVS